MNSQDLSLAGKGKGMSKGSSTRSGLLWEVERILDECKEIGNLPQILLMENVPQVIGNNNIKDFQNWELKLESLGYKNYVERLNSKDYSIPQNRDRCFMISILGDYCCNFPLKKKLKIKLKDVLENNVDEKYYLSDRMKKYIISKLDDKYKVNDKNLVINREIACPKTTREGNSRADTSDYISYELPDNFSVIDSYNKKITDKNVSGCIVCGQGRNQGSMILIKEDNLKTKLCNELIESGKVKEFDVIRHSYSNSRMNGEFKDIKENNISPTLDTRCDCLGVDVKIKNATKQGYLEAEEGDGIDISSRMQHHRGTVQKGMTQTLTTSGGNERGVVCDNLRIRKLTPRECFRLMGVKNEDYNNVATNQSNSSLYHLAGDSIVTTCLMGIFGELLEIDYNAKIDELLKNIVRKE